MGHGERIEEIIGHLEAARVRNVDPALSAAISSALSAVRASAKRALSRERHLSAAARVSVASGALYCVASASRNPALDPEVKTSIRRVAELAAEFSDGAPDEAASDHSEASPPTWTLAPSGAFVRTFENGRVMRILRRPRFPGGEWGIFWKAAPIGSAPTPMEAAEIAERLDRFLMGARA